MATAPEMVKRDAEVSGVKKTHFSVVVAGEFNAGKSSLVNLLFRKPLLPVSVAPAGAPLSHVYPSDRERRIAMLRDGRITEASKYFGGNMGAADLTAIEVEVPAPAFDGAVVTEVPLGTNNKYDDEGLAALKGADLLIWCTMAQRAWSLTEIEIVEALPPAVREGAILVVTRSDYLAEKASKDLVLDRLNSMARKFFADIVTVDCSQTALSESVEDEAAWKRAGGERLAGLVLDRLAASGFKGLRVAGARALDSTEPEASETLEVEAVEESETDVAETAEAEAVEASESETAETSEAESKEASEPETAETSEAETKEASEPEAAETSEASEAETKEAPEPEAAETSEAETKEAPEPEAAETSEAETKEASEPETAETSEAAKEASEPEEPRRPRLRRRRRRSPRQPRRPRPRRRRRRSPRQPRRPRPRRRRRPSPRRPRRPRPRRRRRRSPRRPIPPISRRLNRVRRRNR